MASSDNVRMVLIQSWSRFEREVIVIFVQNELTVRSVKDILPVSRRNGKISRSRWVDYLHIVGKTTEVPIATCDRCVVFQRNSGYASIHNNVT